MINPSVILKAKKAKDILAKNHPDFFAFLKKAKNNTVQEGTVFEISAKTSEGKTLSTQLKLTKEDAQAMQQILSALG